jgi:hypothetical protein
LIDAPSKSIRKSPAVRKLRFPASIEIASRPVWLRASSSSVESEAGSERNLSDKHLQNAPASIRASFEGCSNVTDDSAEHPLKAAGRRHETFEPDSNTTLQSRKQRAKHPSPRYSTDGGMRIDESEPQLENASVPITDSLDPDSNKTLVRRSQAEKQSAPSPSTDEGRQMDRRFV